MNHYGFEKLLATGLGDGLGGGGVGGLGLLGLLEPQAKLCTTQNRMTATTERTFILLCWQNLNAFTFIPFIMESQFKVFSYGQQ